MDKLDCDFYDKLCHARHDAVAVKFRSMDEAIKLNKEQLDYRLESLNDLRRQVVEDRGVFVTKDTFNAKVETYDKFLKEEHPALLQRMSVVETKFVVWGAAILGATAILVTLIDLIMRFLKV